MASLGSKALSGVFWGIGQNLFSRGTGLLVFLLLARLLSVEDFGLTAMAGVFLMLSCFVAESGLYHRTVQRPEAGQDFLDTAFWCCVLLGLASFLLLCGLAGIIAVLTGMPQLESLLPVIGLVALLRNLEVVPKALMFRHLKYQQDAVRGGIASLFSGLVALGFAYAGFGVWALVLQQLLHALLNLALIWRFSGFSPGWTFGRSLLPEIVSFGGNTVLFRALGMLKEQAPFFLLGVFWGPELLGLFAVASRIARAVTDLSVNAINRVTHSIFSRAADYRRDIGTLYGFGLFANSVVLVSPLFALALAGDVVVQVLFGTNWSGAGPILGLLLVGAALGTPGSFCSMVLIADGQPGLAVRVLLLVVPLSLVAYTLLAQASPLSIPIAIVATSLLASVLMFGAAARHFSSRFQQLAPAGISIGCSLGSLALASAGFQLLGLHSAAWQVVAVPAMLMLSALLHFALLPKPCIELLQRLERLVIKRDQPEAVDRGNTL